MKANDVLMKDVVLQLMMVVDGILVHLEELDVDEHSLADVALLDARNGMNELLNLIDQPKQKRKGK